MLTLDTHGVIMLHPEPTEAPSLSFHKADHRPGCGGLTPRPVPLKQMKA